MRRGAVLVGRTLIKVWKTRERSKRGGGEILSDNVRVVKLTAIWNFSHTTLYGGVVHSAHCVRAEAIFPSYYVNYDVRKPDTAVLRRKPRINFHGKSTGRRVVWDDDTAFHHVISANEYCDYSHDAGWPSTGMIFTEKSDPTSFSIVERVILACNAPT